MGKYYIVIQNTIDLCTVDININKDKNVLNKIYNVIWSIFGDNTVLKDLIVIKNIVVQ